MKWTLCMFRVPAPNQESVHQFPPRSEMLHKNRWALYKAESHPHQQPVFWHCATGAQVTNWRLRGGQESRSARWNMQSKIDSWNKTDKDLIHLNTLPPRGWSQSPVVSQAPRGFHGCLVPNWRHVIEAPQIRGKEWPVKVAIPFRTTMEMVELSVAKLPSQKSKTRWEAATKWSQVQVEKELGKQRSFALQFAGSLFDFRNGFEFLREHKMGPRVCCLLNSWASRLASSVSFWPQAHSCCIFATDSKVPDQIDGCLATQL
jgi:hypothetical protein